jgi:dTDP-4-dehydrorhamnose 3,5-epimerase
MKTDYTTLFGKINGVNVIPLPRYAIDERGVVMEMLKETDPHFLRFGQIYFSTVYQGAIKGWHKYRTKVLNYACVSGLAKLVLFDDRKYSSTNGNIMELFIGELNYCLVQVPPMIWNGFKGISQVPAVLANCPTTVFDESDIIRVDPHNNDIPYKWERIDK